MNKSTFGEINKLSVRNTRFPMGLFASIFLILLLMSGVHVGIIQLYTVWNPGNVVKTIIPILYWGVISFGVTLYTRTQMKKTYDEPLQKLAKAAEQVAQGDFSVYVAPINTPDHLDYLDVMYMNFNKMVEELGSIETLKTDFFSNVSHEIKTPISVISNEAQLLRTQGGLDENQLEEVDQIIIASRILSSLITNILKLNRSEKQTIQPEIATYDICEQICECALQFEDIWEEKGIDIDFEMEDRASISADESLMELVWSNLISNAIKFTDKGGRVRIEETSTDAEIIVKIIDNGCGMKPDNVQHIFDKFYQGDTSHATEGNGLGLSVVTRIVTLYHGKIDVESAPGEGSTFTVSLPLTFI